MALASINLATSTSTFARIVSPKPAQFSSSPVLGLPQFRIKGTSIKCAATKNDEAQTRVTNGVAGTLLAAASMSAGPALALVDERMSTEGTGLSLGISNNLLGWIILGVFGVIWSLYTIYTSTLDEDEESDGLSL